MDSFLIPSASWQYTQPQCLSAWSYWPLTACRTQLTACFPQSWSPTFGSIIAYSKAHAALAPADRGKMISSLGLKKKKKLANKMQSTFYPTSTVTRWEKPQKASCQLCARWILRHWGEDWLPGTLSMYLTLPSALFLPYFGQIPESRGRIQMCPSVRCKVVGYH